MEFLTPIILEERDGFDRTAEPVSLGVPFPRGKIISVSQLVILDQNRQCVPFQIQVLQMWPDGSIKWALFDFFVTMRALTMIHYEIGYTANNVLSAPGEEKLTIRQLPHTIIVQTGVSEFFLNPRICQPFAQVTIQGKTFLGPTGNRIVLIAENGFEYEPQIQAVTVEAQGSVRASLAIRGYFGTSSESSFANFLARLNFYAHSSFVEMKFTLHNPRAARHPGGLWDLGDEGSLYFRDLSLYAGLSGDEPATLAWKSAPDHPLNEESVKRLEIYQDSSGGTNWQSTNHVNRFGHVTPQFCGYRVVREEQTREIGQRALPTLIVRSGAKSVAGAIGEFWQNFPKALQVEHQQLVLRLFPAQCGDLYELQGGEQKTHTLFLNFQTEQSFPLEWVHARLLPRLQPEWYAESQAFRFVSPRYDRSEDPETVKLAEQLVESAVSGEGTFFDRREIIDEYGWRNFGELYADHEAVNSTGAHPLVAHYNNQYDVVYGALVQYVRSGNWRWFQLADSLARHVIDIDIYHTQEDRSVFNGGLFWHTDHYSDAATATHRTYSKANLGLRSIHEYGGGPSNEHNYTTGLLYYYFLTGDTLAKEAVQSLANWVIHLDEGQANLLSFFDRRPTGRCSSTVDRDYHGPGRGSGNSINALLDAYCLTKQSSYLTKAEALIQRCIHPRDDIAIRNLGDIEHRWSYTVFLQVLGKYLDLKIELGQFDYMYGYAQESLLHYASWMLDHEAPYGTMLDRVEIPTETWPAQDIRKSVVFLSAARHAPEPLREQYIERAKFFFDACVQDLLAFPTCRLTRPIVLLMTNAFMYAHARQCPEKQAPQPERPYSFGQPKKFTPQLSELYQARALVRSARESAKAVQQRLKRLLRLSFPIKSKHEEKHA